MTKQQHFAILCASVALTCQELTNEELAVLNLVALQDGDPHGRLSPYETVAPLFTEALAAVVNRRLV